MCCRLPNFIEIGWFPLRYGALMICNIADIGHVDFSKFRLCMSRDLYRHAILLPCAKFHWNWAIGCWVMAQNIFKTAAVRHFEFLKNVLGSSGYHRSNFKCAVITKFNQNRIIFRWDMAILRQPSAILNLRNFIQIRPPSTEKMTSRRFSRWRISPILDCRDPIMGSLKSPVKLTQLPIGRQWTP